MKLQVVDRIALLNILPRQGDIFQTKVVTDIRAIVGFGDKEQEAIELKTLPDGSVQWNQEKYRSREFNFGPRAKVLICDTLKDLSAKKQLTAAAIPLWEKFIGPIALEADEKQTAEEATEEPVNETPVPVTESAESVKPEG